MQKNVWEILAMVLYLVLVVGVGVYFFFKGKKQEEGEKEYFLGGRNMGGWVAALSAGASDMSAWVLMGLPGSIYLLGLGQIWISVGLLIGTLCAWIFIAPRLRRFSIRANDSITIPQFLTNRFMSENITLQVVSAIVFAVAYCIYSASSIVACGDLFNTVMGIDKSTAMLIATVVIVVYTLLGGFNAVCWTDFFQGMLMLGALMIVPIIAAIMLHMPGFAAPEMSIGENYYNLLSGDGVSNMSVIGIINGLAWGLGYAGMPHILVRYISIKSEKEMRKSQTVGCVWIVLILAMASVVGIVGRNFLGDSLIAGGEQSLVFVKMVRQVFKFAPFIVGILLSAILAASMSTADSQLLASSSAFASDVYKPLIRKKASNSEMMWAGRIMVIVISVIAFIIANSPNCKGIMALVECAWAAFGSSFGPIIILALYWKRFTYSGAIAGMVTGFAVDAVWYAFLSESTGVYEIIPGFICGMAAAVIVSLISKAPKKEVCDLFEEAKKPID